MANNNAANAHNNNNLYNFALTVLPQDAKTGGPIREDIPFLKRIHGVDITQNPFTKFQSEIIPILKQKEGVHNVNKYTIFAYTLIDVVNYGKLSLYLTNDNDIKNNIDLIPTGSNTNPVFGGYKMLYIYWINTKKRIAGRMNEDSNINIINDNRSNQPSQRRRHNNHNNHNQNINIMDNNENANHNNINNVNNNNNNDANSNQSKLLKLVAIINAQETNQETKLKSVRALLHPRDLHRACLERYLADVAFGTEYAVDIVQGRCPFCNKGISLKEPWNMDALLRHLRRVHGEQGEVLTKRYIDLKKGKTIQELVDLPNFLSCLVVDDGDLSENDDDDLAKHIDWTSKLLPPNENSSVSVLNNTVWRWQTFHTADLTTRTWWRNLHQDIKQSLKQYYLRLFPNEP